MKRRDNAASLGIQLAVAFGLFPYLGYRYDYNNETAPVGLLLGVLLAFIYMVYEIWKLVRLN